MGFYEIMCLHKHNLLTEGFSCVLASKYLTGVVFGVLR